MVEWAKDWVADWDGFAVTLVNIADTDAMAIDDVVVLAPNRPADARVQWERFLRATPYAIPSPTGNAHGRSEGRS